MIAWTSDPARVADVADATEALLGGLAALEAGPELDLAAVHRLRDLGARLARERQALAAGRGEALTALRDVLQGGSPRVSLGRVAELIADPEGAADAARGLAAVDGGALGACMVAAAMYRSPVISELALAPDASIRRTALRALAEPSGRRGPHARVPACLTSLTGLLRAAVEDPDAEVRGYAMELAWACDAVPAVRTRALQAASSDPEPAVRRRALHALAGLDDPVSLELLARTRAGPDPGLAESAAWALGRRPDAITEALLALDDPRRDVRLTALAPLAARLAGVSFFEFPQWALGEGGRSEDELIAKVRSQAATAR